MTEIEFKDFQAILMDIWPGFTFQNKRQVSLWRYAVEGLSVHAAEEYLMQLRLSKKGAYKPDVADFRALLPESTGQEGERKPQKPMEQIFDSFAWMYKGGSCKYPNMIPGYYVLVRVKPGQNVREASVDYRAKHLNCSGQLNCSCAGGLWEVFYNEPESSLMDKRNKLHLEYMASLNKEPEPVLNDPF